MLAAETADFMNVTMPSLPAGAFLAIASIAACSWRLLSANCFSTSLAISVPVSLVISYTCLVYAVTFSAVGWAEPAAKSASALTSLTSSSALNCSADSSIVVLVAARFSSASFSRASNDLAATAWNDSSAALCIATI